MRILPFLLIFIICAFSVKIASSIDSSAFTTFINFFDISKIGIAYAESSADKPQATKPEKKPKKKAITDPSRYNISTDTPEDSLVLDPKNKCTAADYEMFSRLKQRRKELEVREKTLLDKENIILVSERRMNDKINEIKQLREEIKNLLTMYKKEQQDKIDSLVKIYSNMKPKDAARIFEELDMNTLLTVISRMKEAKVAPVLAQMNPIKARDITIELANQRKFSEDICGCKATE